MTTPRQTLVTHIEAMHVGHLGNRRTSGRSLATLAGWHQTWHHRYTSNHYHEGENLGSGARPAGWKTGADAVSVRRAGAK